MSAVGNLALVAAGGAVVAGIGGYVAGRSDGPVGKAGGSAIVLGGLVGSGLLASRSPLAPNLFSGALAPASLGMAALVAGGLIGGLLLGNAHRDAAGGATILAPGPHGGLTMDELREVGGLGRGLQWDPLGRIQSPDPRL